MAYFVDDANHRWCQFLGAVRALDGDRDIGFHTTHLLQKIDVEIGASKLTVGDHLQSGRFLHSDDVAYRGILNGA